MHPSGEPAGSQGSQLEELLGAGVYVAGQALEATLFLPCDPW